MKLIIFRFLAQIIDLLVYFTILVALLLNSFPTLNELINNVMINTIIIFATSIIFTTIFQYPFLKVHQTIGKGFFSLQIVSTEKTRPLTSSIIFQREIFSKLASCYMSSIPLLFGKDAIQDVATQTTVVFKAKK